MEASFHSGERIDATQWLLQQALNEASIVFIPFSAGVMTRFEYELYEKDLPVERIKDIVEQFKTVIKKDLISNFLPKFCVHSLTDSLGQA